MVRRRLPGLEHDYPRITFSFGGARKRIITNNGTVSITAGDMESVPKLTGY